MKLETPPTDELKVWRIQFIAELKFDFYEMHGWSETRITELCKGLFCALKQNCEFVNDEVDDPDYDRGYSLAFKVKNYVEYWELRKKGLVNFMVTENGKPFYYLSGTYQRRILEPIFGNSQKRLDRDAQSSQRNLTLVPDQREELFSSD